LAKQVQAPGYDDVFGQSVPDLNAQQEPRVTFWTRPDPTHILERMSDP